MHGQTPSAGALPELTAAGDATLVGTATQRTEIVNVSQKSQRNYNSHKKWLAI